MEAIRAKWIAADPTVGVELPRRAKTTMLTLDAEEVRALAEAITPRYRAAIYLAAYAGMRAGEVWGLQIGNLDLLRRRVHVRRTLVDVEGHLEFGEPKHGKDRTVPLPRFLVDMLADHVATYVGSPADADALVFTSSEGEPVRHGNFMRRHFYPAVRGRKESPKRRGTAGHPPAPPAVPEAKEGLRFHDLRHTCASLLIAQGAHPKAVAERLGHSSITITMDRYGHLLPSLDEALTDGLDSLYHESGPTTREVVALQ